MMADMATAGTVTERQVRIVPANEASWDDLAAIFGTTELAMRLTTVWKVSSGRPRQLKVILEKRRCSILFHLLVPGG